MALANYADLLAGVANWLNRADLTDRIPEFIDLAESEFNRTLRAIEMEGRATATLTGDAIAVPADFIGVKSITYANTNLDFATPAELFEITTSGTPRYYTVSDGQFFFRPSPSDGVVTIAYYQAIPALTVTNTTNWLMTKHPDLYLFATCAQADVFVWNDERLPLWKARTVEIIDQINGATLKERYGGRRLIAQNRVAQFRNTKA